MDGVDRLSDLSDDLLRRILYFVPSKEAASTSVLSRRWGSLWRTSGAVNLAAHLRYHQNDDYNEAKKEAFLNAAMAALDAAEARVKRLTLRVECDDDDTIDDFLNCDGSGRRKRAEVVRAVLSHPAARRVAELRVAAVDLSERHNLPAEDIRSSKAIYQLVSLPAKTLRVLDLAMCDITRSARKLLGTQLPRLATLRLELCSVKAKFLQSLLDAAPGLTAVHLESVFFQFDGTTTAEKTPLLRLGFQAATTLVLALCGLEVQGRGNTGDMEIHAPKLRSFKYKGQTRRFILGPEAAGIARVDLHFLQSAYDDVNESRRVLFWKFVRNFSNARTLKLKVEYDLADIAAINDRLLCEFPNVERLELEGMHRPKSKTAAVAIANLLQCCPVLGEFLLKLSTVPLRSCKSEEYGVQLLKRKDRLDYSKSIDNFVRRKSKRRRISMEDDSTFGAVKYDDVPGIPILSGRLFACLRLTLRRVGLQFRLDSPISSCLGARLIKFFAEDARVLEEICLDTGNRRLDEHLIFNVKTQIALRKNLAESSSEFSEMPSSSLDSTTNHGRSTTGFTVLPLRRKIMMDCKF